MPGSDPSPMPADRPAAPRDGAASGPPLPIHGRAIPFTLLAGAALILFCEVLLAVDVVRRGGLVIPTPDGRPLPRPIDGLGTLARWVATNMTVLCWIGYLLAADGLLTALGRRRLRRGQFHAEQISSVRARPHRFVVAWLTSIPVWCFFDWLNFYYMHAWRYHGLPDQAFGRYVGYFIAFAAITPGMLLAAQFYQSLGLSRLRGAAVRIPASVAWGFCVLGAGMTLYPLFVPEPIASLLIWVAVFFLLDPINAAMGWPSIVGDWRAGRWGRTFALLAGGATCGFCWEFWNYWARAKWTYQLPFLGAWENARYFEMPWLGFLGFLPFALECWVALVTIDGVMRRLGLRVAEPLPDDLTVL